MASYNGIFTNWIIMLENMGILEVLLPFLLIFTVSFAVMQKSKILGEQGQRFNTIFAFVMAMAAVIPHVINPGGPADVVVIINLALPHVSLLMIACLSALLLLGVFGKDINFAGTQLEGWIVLFSFIAVAYTYLAAAGVLSNPPPFLAFLLDEETRSLLVAILVFGAIVWFITKEEQPLDKRQPLGKTINDMFGGVLGGGKK